MPWDREHDVSHPNALCDLVVAEQPLGEHCPDELCVGHHPIQWEDARHQGRHPPHVIPPDDTGPTEAMGLQARNGLEEITHPLLLLDGWPPQP